MALRGERLTAMLEAGGSETYVHDIETGRTVSWDQLSGAAQWIASRLGQEAAEARVVGVCLRDPLLYAPVVLACWLAGRIPAMLDPDWNSTKVEALRQVAEFGLVVVDSAVGDSSVGSRAVDVSEALGHERTGDLFLDQTSADGPCLLLFSSGSTGVPKCVPLSLENVCANVDAFNQRLGISSDDVFLSVSPLWYAHGLYNGLLTTMILGASVAYNRSLNVLNGESVLAAARESGCTVFHATPSMLSMLTVVGSRTDQPLPRFKHVICGTSELPPVDKQRFEDVFGVSVTQQYGMTETLFMAVNTEHQTGKPHSVGSPVGCTVEIRGDDGHPLPSGMAGEVFVQSPSAYGSYFNQPEATTLAYQREWFRTGDLGAFDEDGYLAITGRKKDLIKKGGFSVGPQEIDDVILQFNQIVESATVGAPDPLYGEEIYSFVVASSPVSEEGLLEHCRSQLQSGQVPRRIFFQETLPRTVSGKIQKQELRDRLKGMLNAS
jgi:acyl-CoA synthetase (AMP-forming)/AMP-acid ligase II